MKWHHLSFSKHSLLHSLPHSTMTTFPLLQLPLLAIDNVLCMMSPLELIDVSLASSRSKRHVKNFSRTKKEFPVYFNNYNGSMLFRREPMTWEFALKKNYNEPNMSSFIERDYEITEIIIKLSEEPSKDIMKWFDHARDVLPCENRAMIDWLAAQSKTINGMEIINDNTESDDDLEYLIKKIHVSGNLDVTLRQYKDDFRMEIPGKPRYLHVDHSISGPIWVPVDNEMFTIKRCDGKKKATVTIFGHDSLCLIVH
uniref:F-box domain-containing protein n=1 Tax=Caenorhabditis tropicalis TaxID=1561998 RepID=A0A1I7UU05_9PELO